MAGPTSFAEPVHLDDGFPDELREILEATQGMVAAEPKKPRPAKRK